MPILRQLALPLGLLLLVPVAPTLHYFTAMAPVWIFVAGAVAIAVLADWIRRATEQVAERTGPSIGGLLNVSFGSLAELILAVFVLMRGRSDVVQAQITGSIMGTGLFGLGLAVVIGSIGRERVCFNRARAGQLSTMLVLVLIALLLPAVFDLTGRLSGNEDSLAVTDEEVSIGVAVVLVLLYAANLLFTLVTHRDVFAADEPRSHGGGWPIWASLLVLAVATALVGLESELVSGALEAAADTLGLTPVFLGVVVLALVGTASDLVAAAWFARDGRMGLVLGICVGSSVQVALTVAPLLVITSWLMGHPMTLVFANPLHLFAIAATAIVVRAVASDGEASWFEGVLLLGVYLLLALAFYFSAPGADGLAAPTGQLSE